MGKLQHLPDHELFVALKKGDTMAYKEVYERYFSVLYLYAFRMLKDKDESEDIIQEVFIMLFTKSSTLEVRSLSALLYTSVRNLVLKKFDHLKVRAEYHASVLNLEQPGINTTEEDLNFQELKKIIESTLDYLPETTRQVFIMARLEEKPHKEIGETLQLSKDKIKKHVGHAVKALKMRLQIFTGLFF